MKKTKTETVVAEVVNDAPIIEEPQSADAAERIRFHLSKARVAGRIALAHIIEAGHELALQKQLLGYGQWKSWCKDNLDISQDSADRYIETFQKTVGVARSAQRIGLDKKLLKKELEAATVGMEEKTVRQAMIEIGVIRPNPNHGGARAGAGRKPSTPAEEVLSDSDAATVLWRDSMAAFEKDRPAFISAARDLRPDVAKHFLDELELLVEALRETVDVGRRK